MRPFPPSVRRSSADTQVRRVFNVCSPIITRPKPRAPKTEAPKEEEKKAETDESAAPESEMEEPVVEESVKEPAADKAPETMEVDDMYVLSFASPRSWD